MCQPGLEFHYGTAVVGGSQRLANLRLPPEHLFRLETFERFPGRKRLPLLVRCDDAQPPISDTRNALGRVAIAVRPAAVLLAIGNRDDDRKPLFVSAAVGAHEQQWEPAGESWTALPVERAGRIQ